MGSYSHPEPAGKLFSKPRQLQVWEMPLKSRWFLFSKLKASARETHWPWGWLLAPASRELELQPPLPPPPSRAAGEPTGEIQPRSHRGGVSWRREWAHLLGRGVTQMDTGQFGGQCDSLRTCTWACPGPDSPSGLSPSFPSKPCRLCLKVIQLCHKYPRLILIPASNPLKRLKSL